MGLGGPVGVALGSYSFIVVVNSLNFSSYSLIVVVVVGSKLGPNGLMLVVVSGLVDVMVADTLADAAVAVRSQQSMVALCLGRLETSFLQLLFPQK